MGSRYRSLAVLILTTLLLSACAPGMAATPAVEQPAATLPPATEQALDEAPSANLTDSCAANYNESVDYFPEKADISYAGGFTVEYHENYKIVEVAAAWPGSPAFRYVLVQCGTPTPEGFDGLPVIEVPVASIVAMSTSYIPVLESIGTLDSLAGVDDFAYVNNPAVRARIEAGDLVAISPGGQINVEQALALDPALIMAFSSGAPEYDVHPALIEAGLPVVMNADWLETVPLGRAEWVKFIALFYNREAAAEEAFAGIEARYEEARDLAASVSDRPVVFTSIPWQGTWYMPGGASFQAVLLRDAGADYLYADDTSTGSLFLDFETVFNDARDADVWIDLNGFATLADLAAADQRYAEFAAFRSGRAYGYDARQTEYGNEYFETGAANPDVILRDLVAIFHPELMPDHELYYYRQVQ
ncbi:MAG: ABC transporter substrate-binding protein [Anaerolineae bacterium]|nr:ABC transporter substrate-binding protein [Anaerolineae bacterium]